MAIPSLFLRCGAPSSPTLCRFIPALSDCPLRAVRTTAGPRCAGAATPRSFSTYKKLHSWRSQSRWKTGLCPVYQLHCSSITGCEDRAGLIRSTMFLRTGGSSFFPSTRATTIPRRLSRRSASSKTGSRSSKASGTKFLETSYIGAWSPITVEISGSHEVPLVRAGRDTISSIANRLGGRLLGEKICLMDGSVVPAT